METRGEIRWSERVSTSCSECGTRHDVPYVVPKNEKKVYKSLVICNNINSLWSWITETNDVIKFKTQNTPIYYQRSSQFKSNISLNLQTYIIHTYNHIFFKIKIRCKINEYLTRNKRKHNTRLSYRPYKQVLSKSNIIQILSSNLRAKFSLNIL